MAVDCRTDGRPGAAPAPAVVAKTSNKKDVLRRCVAESRRKIDDHDDHDDDSASFSPSSLSTSSHMPSPSTPGEPTASSDDDELESLRRENESLRAANATLARQRDEAASSLDVLRDRQRDLYDNFKLLRDKYDDVKSELRRVLWEYLPTAAAATVATREAGSGGSATRSGRRRRRDDLDVFADLSCVDRAVYETPDRIGEYEIGSLLGEGQFADVRRGTNARTGKELAIKIMPKTKALTINRLKRIQCEINVLRAVSHPNVVTFVDVIHSPTCVYLLTEVGGADLFEFFDANPHGVSNNVARQIVLGIVEPLVYLHSLGICHRDLKPENVLLKVEGGGGDGRTGRKVSHKHVQICDFGQCVEISNVDEKTLSDLCGSPGFFAPEMILCGDGKYNGFKADVWSLGCIMLELTRGHDDFCTNWMASYDYEILQDEASFEASLGKAVERIGDDRSWEVPPASGSEMVDFLCQLLVMDPGGRMASSDMLAHNWLGNGDCDRVVSGETQQGNDVTPVLNNVTRQISDGEDFKHGVAADTKAAGKRSLFRDSLSSRARKHFAGSNGTCDKVVVGSTCGSACGRRHNGPIEIRLPPIEPRTPSLKDQKKVMKGGEQFVFTDM